MKKTMQVTTYKCADCGAEFDEPQHIFQKVWMLNPDVNRAIRVVVTSFEGYSHQHKDATLCRRCALNILNEITEKANRGEL